MATIYKHDGKTRLLGLPFKDISEAEFTQMRPLHQRHVVESGAWKRVTVKAEEAEQLAPTAATEPSTGKKGK
jgi:hypothetical protein